MEFSFPKLGSPPSTPALKKVRFTDPTPSPVSQVPHAQRLPPLRPRPVIKRGRYLTNIDLARALAELKIKDPIVEIEEL